MRHVHAGVCVLIYFIFGSREEEAAFKLATNPPQTPAAVATPHPSPPSQEATSN